MSRFVLLRHEGTAEYKPGVHWDLMLEAGGALRTWALQEPPTAESPVAAEQLADHRLAYLDYEGPIDGDRGSVTRHDWGEFIMLRQTPREIVFDLVGLQLRGRATLTRLTDDSSLWQLLFNPQPGDSPP